MLNRLYREISLGLDSEKREELDKMLSSPISKNYEMAKDIIQAKIVEILNPILETMPQEELNYLVMCIDKDFINQKAKTRDLAYNQIGSYLVEEIELEVVKHCKEYGQELQRNRNEEIQNLQQPKVEEKKQGFIHRIFTRKSKNIESTKIAKREEQNNTENKFEF